MTPLFTALLNRQMLRRMRLTVLCRSPRAMLCMLRLLTATEFLCMLQKCGSRSYAADPLFFEGLMSVTALFGPTLKLSLCMMLALLLQENWMFEQIIRFLATLTLGVLGVLRTLGPAVRTLLKCSNLVLVPRNALAKPSSRLTVVANAATQSVQAERLIGVTLFTVTRQLLQMTMMANSVFTSVVTTVRQLFTMRHTCRPSLRQVLPE